MKVIKVMSIIGIAFFGLVLIIIIGLNGSRNSTAAAGWGIIALLYAIPFSIVCLVQSIKSKGNIAIKDVSNELLNVNNLKEKGIISEEEFNSFKARILSGKQF